MFSSEDPGLTGGQNRNSEGFSQDRNSGGFIKSVIKVLSGSRLRTPDESTRASPEIEPLEEYYRTQNSDELMNQGSASRESSEKRGYEDEDQSLPIGESENHKNALDDVDQIRVKMATGSLVVHSPAHDYLVRPQSSRLGLSTEFESDLRSAPSKLSSRAFSSFPLPQPLGVYHAAGTAGPEVYSYFRQPSPAHGESGGGELDESSSVRIGKQQAQNVTHRDPKRPKERSKDRAYKQRFSMGSSSDMVDH
jgi:hypothetical protein